MQMSAFMARVVPTGGNYVAMCWMGPPKSDGKRSPIHRFFPIAQDGFRQAEGMLTWAVRKQTDAYFALAAYTLATQETNQWGPVWKGNRKTENVQSIKVLVIDADVSRPGDGKDPAKGECFPDRATCLTWVTDFATRTGLRRPTIIVNSGYGYHFYWCLDQALTVAQWKPVSQAFLAAMQACGWRGDTQATVDAARILRPPGTVNIKSGIAASVEIVGTVLPDDYKLGDVVAALAPYMAAQVQTAARRASGGGVTPILSIGQRPVGIPEDIGDNQNAGAGLEPDGFPERTYRFSNIWPKCEQLKYSVNTRGEHDTRDIWRLDNMPTLGFCVDGGDWVHPISDAHPTYKPEDTDAQFAQTLDMIQNKNLRPTKCTTFARHRPGVCDTCAFHEKISTPLQLGEDAETLPRGWRIENETLQRWNPKDKDWVFVAAGAFSEPVCRRLSSRAHELTFTYKLGGSVSQVAVADADCSNTQSLQGHLALAGISCTPDVAGRIGVFLVAWINKLKEANAVVQGSTARPFGWNIVNGKCVGFAVAGILYRSDGTVQQLMVPDGTLASAYTPTGDESLWRRAATYFEGSNRPDLQVAVAASFGAPLMGLTSDVAGMTLNMWSPSSGVGKTTAFRFAQAIWGKRSHINSKSDTVMSFFNALGGTRVMPRWWDEYQSDKEELTKLVYDIPQGRERNRLTATIRQREGGEWETILVVGSNRALSNTLILDHTNTDAAVLRILDIPLPKLPMSADGTVSRLVNELKDNYGHVGRVYAAYLGSNHELIKTMLVQVHNGLALTINRPEERFYLAVCTSILVGALVAKQIGLFDFDIAGVKQVLLDAVLASRTVRAGGFILSNGSYDLTSVIGNFLNENTRKCIRTNVIMGLKHKPGSINVVVPWPTEEIIAQVAASGTIRIHRASFNRWLEEKKLPSAQITAQMRTDWKIVEHKVTLAGGTGKTTVQMLCFDIDKTIANDPDLDPIFDTGAGSLI